MKWKIPPIIKIYEALGNIGDSRIYINGNTARVYSSSGNKFYTIEYDESENAIMVNDNGSFYQGYLGYPAIAYLMKIGKLSFDEKYSQALKDIPWKDINVKNRNNFKKTRDEIDNILKERGINLKEFYDYLLKVEKEIEDMGLNFLGEKKQPPSGY